MNLQVVVYTPVHNRSFWLKGCMESVASQDYPHKRHVLVDDCSTDNSFETAVALLDQSVAAEAPEGARELVIGEFRGCKVAVARLEKNLGPAGARNWAIKTSLAYGDVFGNLDSDDRYRPGYLSTLMQAFRHEEVGVAYCDYEVINHTSKTVVREFKEPFSHRRIYEDCLLCNNSLVRKAAFEAVNGYDERLRVAEDWDLWIRISQHFLLYHIPECLLEIHAGVHGSTTTVPPERWAQDRQLVARKAMEMAGRGSMS